jgi:hypothetical protein
MGTLSSVAAFVVIGAGLLHVRGAVRRDARDLRRPVTDPALGEALVRCFRSVVIGLAVAAIGIAWISGLDDLLGLALIIGVGEILETTSVLRALRAGGRLPRHRAPRYAPGLPGAAHRPFPASIPR